MKKLILNLVKLSVTVGILLLIFKKFQIGWDDIATALSNAKWEWFVAAILTQVAAITFSILRWRVLLVAQGLKVPPGHLIKTYLVGRFLGTFTPTGVGLEAYKAYDIARYTSEGTTSVTVVFVEKFLTLLALSIITVITLSFIQLNTLFIAAFFAFFAVIAIMLLILIFKASILLSIVRMLPMRGKTEGPATQAVESFERFKNTKGAMLTSIVYGVLVYVFLFSTFFTNGMALGLGGSQPGMQYLTPASEKIGNVLTETGIEYIERDDGQLEMFLTHVEYQMISITGIELVPQPQSGFSHKGLGLLDVLIVGPLTQIATMIPLSIAGIGLREGAFVELLRSKGVWVAQRTVLAASMWYFVSVSVNIFGAILFLTRRTDYKTKITREEFQRATSSK